MFRDPGSFWHVAAGERMLAGARLIREDIFSFTRAGSPWVADQWLAELGMAAIHRLCGWDGLLLASATLLAAFYAWLGSRLLGAGMGAAPATLLLALAFLAGAPQFHVRPLLATLVLYAATFALLVDVEAGRRRFISLGWLVPLFVLWTNLHGGVLGGLGTAAICLAGWSLTAACRFCKVFFQCPTRDETIFGEVQACSTFSKRLRHIVPVLMLLALAATPLVNPYGLALPREWLDTLAMPLPRLIEEHAPLSFAEPVGWAVAALAAFYLACLAGAKPSFRITWLVPLAWFALAMMRVRNAPLFAVAALIALADMLPHSAVGRWLAGRGWMREEPDSTREAGASAGGKPSHLRLVGILAPLVVVAAAALQLAGMRVPVVGRGWARFDAKDWPVELLPAIQELNDSSPEGERVFNDMRFGGFLIFHAPRLRVFVDDRCPLYGTAYLTAYDRARREAPEQIDRWREAYGFRHALVESGGRFDAYLSHAAGWKLVGRARAAALYRFAP